MSSFKAWLLAATLALSGIASSASVPQRLNIKRQVLEQGSSISVSEVSDDTTQVVPMDESMAQELFSTTGRTEVDTTPNLENSVVIHTKTSKVVIPVERNPSISTLREERVFLVFPEANPATAATEIVTEETPEVTESLQETEDILTSALNTDEETSIRFGAQEADKTADESIIFPSASFRSEEQNIDSVTPEEELSSTTTSKAEGQTKEASSTTTTSTVEISTTTDKLTPTSPTTPSTTTRRAYRGTPRTTKRTTSTTAPAPSTTTEEIGNLISSTTEENSSESQESDEETVSAGITTHRTPHFDVTKAPVLRPAPKPSARLVAFLKKRPGGIIKRVNSQIDPTDSLTSSTSTAPTTTTTSTTPETTTKVRRGNLFGARNRPKMLDRSSSEPEGVTITPPDSVLERRRARFYSSASSMLSGFVPSVSLPRASTGEMYIRNSRKACANPAGCIKPEDAEVLMAALQKNDTSDLTQEQTPVSETTKTIRSRLRGRRPNSSSSRSRTTVAPSTTTLEIVRSAAQRLAQRRRTKTTSTTTPTTTTSSTTTPMPSVITMKQIQEIVVSPAPITVASNLRDATISIMPQQPRLILQPLATPNPLFQRLNKFENKLVPAKVPSHYGQQPQIHHQFMHSGN